MKPTTTFATLRSLLKFSKSKGATSTSSIDTRNVILHSLVGDHQNVAPSPTQSLTDIDSLSIGSHSSSSSEESILISSESRLPELALSEPNSGRIYGSESLALGSTESIEAELTDMELLPNPVLDTESLASPVLDTVTASEGNCPWEDHGPTETPATASTSTVTAYLLDLIALLVMIATMVVQRINTAIIFVESVNLLTVSGVLVCYRYIYVELGPWLRDYHKRHPFGMMALLTPFVRLAVFLTYLILVLWIFVGPPILVLQFPLVCAQRFIRLFGVRTSSCVLYAAPCCLLLYTLAAY
ncbi:hypothetical protein BKA62DRAFT_768876 [Auriculariales sp. MPI-PUGE-AT-0066]|nr:hypothetical protein BKA62DRAFT_768876 [Auriculariales sp. MPI-PUGE-AT-0066]